jgi:hypothetical protein
MLKRRIGTVFVSIGLFTVFLGILWNSVFFQMIRELPNLLGFRGEKTFLVLFQNNFELRPTGGFMGSYGLLKFDRGKADLTVEDIYAPDGQVAYHIDPPAPIQEAFKLGTWRLRDANWDPDFPESAKTLEWFFDKAGISYIDGVIATNLSTFQKLLKIVEPVPLLDYSEEITEKNVWEKAQFYSQENFFPGSRQKKEFLSDLSKEVLKKFLSSSLVQKFQAGKVLYRALGEKQVLMYSNNEEAQKQLEALNWAGATQKPRCLPWLSSCVADSLFVVEANLGVNKANCCIERKEELFVTIDGLQIHHKLQLTLTNNSSLSRWGGRYKAWVRVLYPQGEKALWVEVPEGKSHVVTVEYETKNGKNVGPYSLLLQKQSGIEKIPFTLHLTRNGVTKTVFKEIKRDELLVL